MNDSINVVVCGGGRTGHLNATLFKKIPGVKVSLLTRRADEIRNNMPTSGIRAILPNGIIFDGRIDRVSNQAAEVMQDADIVILALPANARLEVLRNISPHIPKNRIVYVGAMPGCSGFDWLAEYTLKEHENVVIWGMKDVPYTAYTPNPGVSVVMGGAKTRLQVAVHARHDIKTTKKLLDIIQRLYPARVELLKSYLEITLTTGNQLMHSSVLYGLIGPYSQWDGKPFSSEIYWWKECSELGAYFLQRTDEEAAILRRKVESVMDVDLSEMRSLKDELAEAYGAQIENPRTLLTLLRTNRAYLGKIPLVKISNEEGLLLDTKSRAFQEDVPFGLSLLVEMARRLHLNLPHIFEIYDWCVSYMGGFSQSALEYFPDTWPEKKII